MRNIRKIAVGGVVGLALTLGINSVALAAPSSTSTTGTSTPGTSTPGTSTPGTSTPGTSGTGTSSTPATKAGVLTGPEIWRIVEPRHLINCPESSKELKRIHAAVTAAGKRVKFWQARSAADQKRHGKKVAKRVKLVNGRSRGFQKLEQDGQSLISRIDAKCDVATTTG
jgi:hypothetical protein